MKRYNLALVLPTDLTPRSGEIEILRNEDPDGYFVAYDELGEAREFLEILKTIKITANSGRAEDVSKAELGQAMFLEWLNRVKL